MGRERTRDERRRKVEELRLAQQRAERRRSAVIVGVAAVVVLAIAGAVTFAVLRERANRPDLTAVKTYKVSQGHVTTPVKYSATPPAGGAHAPVWLNCGTYDKTVPNENAVHAMEHGAVWITYRPDLPAADVAALRQATPDTYAILSPYPSLPAPVVVSAWGKQLLLTGAKDPRLPAFIRAYRQGPETPELGASCTGGTDGTDATPSSGGGMPAPTTATPGS